MPLRLCVRSMVVAVLWLLALPCINAQTSEPAAAAAGERDITAWLQRLHAASQRRAYVGTLVVSSGSSMSSARIWHVCDGGQQMDRVESLTGAPRSTFRRNDEVITFSPLERVAVVERRESLRLFPNLLQSVETPIAQFYGVKAEGAERVAGLDADVVRVQPKDGLRFGYRIWSEQRSGLVIRIQTLDAQGRVLEQAAFSELQLDAPVSMERLERMMSNRVGYQVITPEVSKTTPQAEGWRLAQEVPGFRSMSCHRRQQMAGARAVQWVFSDGLATVSMFIEPLDPRQRLAETIQGMGATHALTRRVLAPDGPWWLTVVGEAPVSTLQLFAQGLERAPP